MGLQRVGHDRSHLEAAQDALPARESGSRPRVKIVNEPLGNTWYEGAA